MTEIKSLLLLGPPGAGKSPFSQYLSRLITGRCHFLSFDFGQELRDILSHRQKEVRPGEDDRQLETSYSHPEITRILESVNKAVLFEEQDRELARKILKNFLNRSRPSAEDILVLNGLPRHQAQVAWLEGLAKIVLAVNLDCPEEISIKRILANLDGERQGRSDDLPAIISRRYRLYEERTKPLIDFLREKEIPVLNLSVDEATRPEDLFEEFSRSEIFNLLISD